MNRLEVKKISLFRSVEICLSSRQAVEDDRGFTCG